jgi:nucleotide-binding universal stress UspA family protein
MGSGQRKGIADILIGSTTERITSNVGCSIFAVKPRGFVSPLEQDST